MITKTAFQLGIGSLVGALRASKLSDADKKLLAKAYNLTKDSNFGGRSALRGEVGNLIGDFGGTIAGALGASALGATAPAAILAAGIGCGVPAAIYGIVKGTNKYSKKGVEKARALLEKNKQHTSKED